MFKRVEKRRRKKEEEEELGLDEDMKQILGMHDTDSEESDSEQDSSGDDSEDGLGELEGLGADLELGEDDEDGDEDGEFLDEGSESEEEAPKDLNPRIPISKALLDPIYLDLVDPMAHQRRVKQFKKRVEEKKVQPSDDAFTFIHEALPKGPVVVPTPKVQTEASGKSNRALKKEKTKELRKARRDKAKERRAKKVVSGEKPEKSGLVPDKVKKRENKAKSPDEGPTSQGLEDGESRPKKKARLLAEKSAVETEPSSPPKKRLKNAKAMAASSTNEASPALDAPTIIPSAQPSPVVRTSLADTIKTIASSATDRAKNARTKASSTTSRKQVKRLKAKRY